MCKRQTAGPAALEELHFEETVLPRKVNAGKLWLLYVLHVQGSLLYLSCSIVQATGIACKDIY